MIKAEEGKVSVREGGVYLITGGTGALGLMFAEHLARQARIKLVLTDLPDLSPEKETRLQALEALGAEVAYIKADVSQRQDVERLVAEAKSHFGEINGIVHCAGVIRDSFVIKKTKEELDTVLAPKVYGVIFLDEATQHENLDFFITFSSIAGLMGNPGQCDYAYANSFLDAYAHLRETRRRQGSRQGKTLSINWPLWKEGGMRIDEKIEKSLAETTGMKPLTTQSGLKTFDLGLTSGETQLLAVEGDRHKFESLLGRGRARSEQVSPRESVDGNSEGSNPPQSPFNKGGSTNPSEFSFEKGDSINERNA